MDARSKLEALIKTINEDDELTLEDRRELLLYAGELANLLDLSDLIQKELKEFETDALIPHLD